MTVLEIIQRSTAYLTERGVDSARLNAELILSHVLKRPRLRLYLEFDQPVGEAETTAARELVRRRGKREPLQHLTGSAPFLGHELRVGPEVLVPRPETESLAQAAIQYLQTPGSLPSPRVLDFGTGSGCLAIAIAAAIPAAEVHALDISPSALALARANAREMGLERIRFHAGDGFASLPPERDGSAIRFHLIVSNPPYIPTADIASLDPEVRDHDPRLALDGGPDGLQFYHRLALEAPQRLSAGGTLMVELGDGQSGAACEIFKAASWRIEGIEKDLSGRERVLIVCIPTAN